VLLVLERKAAQVQQDQLVQLVLLVHQLQDLRGIRVQLELLAPLVQQDLPVILVVQVPKVQLVLLAL
jgi:hypothetical protein